MTAKDSDDKPRDESALRIRVRDDGPLVVEGSLTIVDADGRAFPLPTNKPLVALCRCGRSQIKPFCDGSHKTCGFEARQRAPFTTEPS